MLTITHAKLDKYEQNLRFCIMQGLKAEAKHWWFLLSNALCL